MNEKKSKLYYSFLKYSPFLTVFFDCYDGICYSNIYKIVWTILLGKFGITPPYIYTIKPVFTNAIGNLYTKLFE